MELIKPTLLICLLVTILYISCPIKVFAENRRDGSIIGLLNYQPEQNKSDNPSSSNQTTNQPANNQSMMPPLSADQINFTQDKYENFAPQDKAERKIFDADYLEPQK